MNSAIVSISQQLLTVFNEQQDALFNCAVNTAKNGVGCLQDSGCTPIGQHYVRACIGEGLSPYAALSGRRPTGEEWSHLLMQTYSQRDWILGRILWLCGLESGINRGGQVDTFRRYIYIHGSPEWPSEMPPSSHGCVRVQPEDMMRVYQLLPYGARVSIES